MFTGAVAATGFYFGAEIVTVAAAESAEPEEAVARGHRVGDLRGCSLFYLGSIFLMVAWCPGTRPGDGKAPM